MNIFEVLNLEHKGLEEVKILAEKDRKTEALKELRKYYVNRKKPLMHYNLEDKEVLAEYIKKEFPQEVEETFNVAEEVAEKKFLFRHNWDMEKTNIPVKFEGDIDWEHILNSDPEWMWVINRQRFWISLGQAYFLSGDEKYARVFTEQLCHWIDSNPTPEGRQMKGWRRIEAGIRGEHWSKAFHLLKGSEGFTEEVLEKFLLSIHTHGEYLVSEFNPHSNVSNWGIIEHHGLYDIGLLFPELKRAKEWKDEALRRLELSAGIQVYEDGIHWEQSSMYHHEVLHCFLDNIHLSRINGVKYSQLIEDQARKMSYASMYMKKPDHKQPLRGDSDDSDIRDILTNASYIFEDGILKKEAFETLDFENIFYYGIEGIKKYSEIKEEYEKEVSKELPYSGNYIMRSHWNEDAKYLNFSCGVLGGGHGHQDILHFDLCADGRNYLCDSGRYTYVEGDERKSLKLASAHNVTMVDDMETFIPKGSWDSEYVPSPCDNRWISTDEFDFVQGGHKGYLGLADPVSPLRQVIFVKPNYWFVIDTFNCKDDHKFTQLFHFADEEIKLTDNHCRTTYNDVNLSIMSLSEGVNSTIVSSEFSPEYNLKRSSKTLRCDISGKGFTSMVTLLYPESGVSREIISIGKVKVYEPSKGEVLDDSVAEAFKITFEGGESHTLVTGHGTGRLNKEFYKLEEYGYVQGSVVLIKEADGEVEKIRIK